MFLLDAGPMCLILVVVFFFFQAEDGIRDLVRSRGLGDVYKRQAYFGAVDYSQDYRGDSFISVLRSTDGGATWDTIPVSYTHLTLPTSDLV